MLLYIDPGTGSMLFTVLLGLIGAAAYAIRMLWIKLRFKLSGGKAEVSNKKIPLVIFADDKRYWSIFDPICREPVMMCCMKKLAAAPQKPEPLFLTGWR